MSDRFVSLSKRISLDDFRQPKRLTASARPRRHGVGTERSGVQLHSTPGGVWLPAAVAHEDDLRSPLAHIGDPAYPSLDRLSELLLGQERGSEDVLARPTNLEAPDLLGQGENGEAGYPLLHDTAGARDGGGWGGSFPTPIPHSAPLFSAF